MKADNPDIKFGEVGKVLGEMWKNIGPEEKSKYEEQAKVEKVKAQAAMDAYKAQKAEAGEG